jgi:hypothetical protein
MLADADLKTMLDAYTGAIEGTQRAMAVTGVVAGCTDCAGKKPGGCCFQGVEEWYDPVLLLINFLLGVDIPDTPVVPGGCLFAGPRGCQLRARYSFCINYLCPAIQEFLSEDETAALLKAAGEELGKGLEMEKKVIQWLRENGITLGQIEE